MSASALVQPQQVLWAVQPGHYNIYFFVYCILYVYLLYILYSMLNISQHCKILASTSPNAKQKPDDPADTA